MEEDVRVKEESCNSCCQVWKEKYTKLKERHSKLEEARNALRKGLTIFEQQIAKIQSENITLKKAYEDVRARAESEKEDNVKESAKRVALENEVSTLKSEILLLQERGGLAAKSVDEEVVNLRGRVSEAETGKNQLKELLEKERKKVDAERGKVDEERKKAEEAMKKIKAESKKACEEKRIADVERKKAEELRLQLETFKCEVDEAKSKLALEAARYEQEKKKLKAERENTTKERKRADMVMAKAAEQEKLAEENLKKAMDERCRADELSQLLEQNKERIEELEKQIHELVALRKLVKLHVERPTARHAELAGEICSETNKTGISSLEACEKFEELEKKIMREKKHVKSEMKKAEKQRKVAAIYKRQAMEEKHRAESLSRELECNKARLGGVQKEIQELVSSGKVLESSHPASGGNLEAETAEIKLLKNQLKFEKKRVKHAKEVAKLEVSRNCILRQEVHRLKQDFIQFSQRLEVLDNSLFHKFEGTNHLEKKRSLQSKQGYFDPEPSELILHTENELVKQPSCTVGAAIGGSDALKQNKLCIVPLPPISGEIYTSPTTGIESNLELLLRGSNSKMLQSSAINSSSASFSDRQLVGSQERGTISVTASAKLTREQKLEPTTSRRSGGTRKSSDEKLVVGAENSVGSPTKFGATERTGCHRKRKRLPDTVESIEHLYSEGQKWHQQVLQKLSALHGMLDGESSKSLQVEGLQEKMYSKSVRPQKKKKAANGVSVAMHTLNDPSEVKTKAGTLVAEGYGVCKQASATECNLIETAAVLKDGMDDLRGSKLHLPRNSEQVFGHDNMKLLDLDNDFDEKRFLKAIEKPISPLSPTLCNIDFSSHQASEIGIVTLRHPADESLYEEFSKAEDNIVPSCSFDVVNLEIDSNERTLKDFGDSKVLSSGMTMPPNGNCGNKGNNGSDDLDFICAGNASSGQMQRSSMLSTDPRNKNLKISSERSDAFKRFPKHCVVLSNNSDSSTVSKILYVTSDCLSQCSSNCSLKILIQNILLSLRKDDYLSAKEQVSVIFSLLLPYISETANDVLGKAAECDSLQRIDSFAQQMHAVLNDVDTREMFLQSCDMYELMALTEDFLLNRRILVFDDVSHGSMLPCDSRKKVVLDGNCIFWSIQAASTDLLSAGGLLLGSICSAIDQIGFVCEVSCNIFSLKTIDSSLLLRLLHMFAYLCGSKLFTLEDYALEMSVLKCLVVLLERQNPSMDCFTSLPSVAASTEISVCSACPFSDGAVSVDSILSVILEKLQNCALSHDRQQDLWDTLNSSRRLALFNEMRTEDVQHHGEAVLPNFFSNQYFCYFIDILSLVELVASFMSWDWTFSNIISWLFQMLDSCTAENLFPAIITLLGQLGRLGVDAKGHEASEVECVREWLSAFLGKNTFRNFGLPVQFASVCALVGLIAGSFEEVVESNIDVPMAGSQSIARDCVREWFSSLSYEQQSSFRSLQSSSKCISTKGYHAVNSAV